MMLRPYRETDLPSLLDVWERASRLAHSFLPEEFFAREAALMEEQFLPASETWVADDRGRLVGFVAVHNGEIGGLFVDPDHHREGVGRSLVDHVVARHGLVELDVFEANPLGRAFYDGVGFVLVRRATDDETGLPVLRLRLSD